MAEPVEDDIRHTLFLLAEIDDLYQALYEHIQWYLSKDQCWLLRGLRRDMLGWRADLNSYREDLKKELEGN